jgi:MFS family permease
MIQRTGAFTPLLNPAFRLLWLTWLAANICMWMNEMASAWLMTSLTTSTTMIALVQTAATVPVFVLSMPSGVMADLLDRRGILMATQIWTALVALAMAMLSWTGTMAPGLLLAMVAASGASLAMRGPAYVASVPEMVARADWPKAFALGGVAGHGARVAGPVAAGILISAGGSQAVYAFNAVMATIAAAVLWHWREPQATVHAGSSQPLAREPFWTAMRAGVQYVGHSRRLCAILLRVFGFYVATVGLLALLPAMVRHEWHGQATTYTSTFALIGSGAVAAIWVLPLLKSRWSDDRLLMAAMLAYAIALCVVAASGEPWHAAPALVFAGSAWMVAANQFTTAMQTALPSWARARGMSIYHTTLMAGNAVGAFLWGRLADTTSLRVSLLCAGVACTAGLLLVRATASASLGHEDLTPDAFASLPVTDANASVPGRVVTTIEYKVACENHAQFERLMQDTMRSRAGCGARGWRLMRDAVDVTLFTETFFDVSWTEMRRRVQRSVVHDRLLRDQRHALHIGPDKPRVRIFSDVIRGPVRLP